MVARPATEPVNRPTNLGCRALSHSISSHVTAANDAAISVFRKDEAVIASTRNSEPALKPYQPNHSRPVPSAISGTLCGLWGITRRRPTYSTEANGGKP